MKIRELRQEINKLNIQDNAEIVAFGCVDGEEYEFEIIGVHRDGVSYIELGEVQE